MRSTRKSIALCAGAICLGTFLYFALRPTMAFSWTDLILVFLSALSACIWIAFHATRFANWRILACLIGLQLLAQGWLQWQWNIWESEIRSLNALVALGAVDSFTAILMVGTLLLIRRDASVIALAVVWIGCPLGLLLTMARYETAAQIETLPIRESSLLLAAICLLSFLALGGILAFSLHLLRHFYLELADKG